MRTSGSIINSSHMELTVFSPLLWSMSLFASQSSTARRTSRLELVGVEILVAQLPLLGEHLGKACERVLVGALAVDGLVHPRVDVHSRHRLLEEILADLDQSFHVLLRRDVHGRRLAGQRIILYNCVK